MDNNRKDETKIRICLFIIGLLIGAIISTSAFVVSVNMLGVNSSGGQQSQMPSGGTPPEMPSNGGGQGEQPPAKPGEGSNES